jgi:methylthioribose-1-phosphate isomerase
LTIANVYSSICNLQSAISAIIPARMNPIATIEWIPASSGSLDDGAARLIDQTLLPTEERFIDVRDAETMWEAIRMLRVRGAPAIGVAAAYGVFLGVRDARVETGAELLARVAATKTYLDSARPTAVNLFWATERMAAHARAHAHLGAQALKAALLTEAIAIHAEDIAVCNALGQHGASLIKDGQTWLTHCNAGALATAGIGTATSGFYTAQAEGKRIKVYADETRPLLQGARLTAYELHRAGIPVTVITDNMTASVMAQGRIDGVCVGTDRLCANGDFANKIGTLGVAILAREFGVPFYVSAPVSSIDMSLSSGAEIPIEERFPDEVSNGFGRRTAPEGVSIYNPAFDVTPHRYLTAIITERGIVYPPFDAGLRALLAQPG